MVKNDICFRSVSKQNALFSKKCAPNNTSMSSMSRIGHIFINKYRQYAYIFFEKSKLCASTRLPASFFMAKLNDLQTKQLIDCSLIWLYKSLESGNGTKKSDEKWCLVKLKYLENKKWWRGIVKSTRIMNAQQLQWCIMFPTDFWKKLGFTSEVWVFSLFCEFYLAPSWQHFGSRCLCQLSLVELYYRLIDLNQDSKVIQGVKQ